MEYYTDNLNEGPLRKFYRRLNRAQRRLVDKYIIYKKARWGLYLLLVAALTVRIITYQGFFIVFYVYGIYILHLLIQFCTPKGLPTQEELEDDEDVNEDVLLTFDNHAPIIRKVSEFKFWKSLTFFGILALLCTVSPIFDLPVFWPFLLLYFLLLMLITARRQFRHMKKFGYSALDFGKKTKI